MARLRYVRAGEPITAAAHNALVDAVGRLDKVTAALPLEVRRLPGGIHLSLAHEERVAVAQLAGSLTAGGAAAANVLWWTGAVWGAAATGPITVYDALNNPYLPSATRVIVRFDRQAGRWLVLTPSDQLLGKLDGVLTNGGSQTVSVWSGSGGMESDTGVNVTAFDWLLKAGDSLAANTKVIIERMHLEWYVTSAACP